MELRHLRYFCAVAESRHFGRAAQQLHIAQPGLSQAVRQLETDIGAPLFTRTTRQVDLTPAGEFFHEEVRGLLDRLEDTTRGVRRIAGGHAGLVRIAFTGTATFDQLPRLARTLQEQLPDVALEIHADQLTPTQVDGLRSGDIDLAVLRPTAIGDDLAVRTITSEPLTLALPSQHPLARTSGLTLADVSQDDFVVYSDPHSAVASETVGACRAAGFSPRTAHQAPSTSVVLALVAAGLGVAVVPDSARALPLDGVAFRELVDAPRMDLSLAWVREGAPALVRSVVDALEAHDFFDAARLEGTR